jgi:hypothetical protein
MEWARELTCMFCGQFHIWGSWTCWDVCGMPWKPIIKWNGHKTQYLVSILILILWSVVCLFCFVTLWSPKSQHPPHALGAIEKPSISKDTVTWFRNIRPKVQKLLNIEQICNQILKFEQKFDFNMLKMYHLPFQHSIIIAICVQWHMCHTWIN